MTDFVFWGLEMRHLSDLIRCKWLTSSLFQRFWMKIRRKHLWDFSFSVPLVCHLERTIQQAAFNSPGVRFSPLATNFSGFLLSYFPVIILNLSPFTPYCPDLATLTYLALLSFPRRPESELLPLKRIIYTAPVWDRSNLCGTIEYTNLRSDIPLAEGEADCECKERERIKHAAAPAFDLPFPPFLFFKGPVRSRPADAWAGAPAFFSFPRHRHRQTPWNGATVSRLFIFIFVLCGSKKTETDFLWSLVSRWVIAEINIHTHA